MPRLQSYVVGLSAVLAILTLILVVVPTIAAFCLQVPR